MPSLPEDSPALRAQKKLMRDTRKTQYTPDVNLAPKTLRSLRGLLAAAGLGSGGSKSSAPQGNVASMLFGGSGGAASQSRAAINNQKNAAVQGKIAEHLGSLVDLTSKQTEAIQTWVNKSTTYHKDSLDAFYSINKTLRKGFIALGARGFGPGDDRNRNQGLGLGDLLMARMMGLGGGGRMGGAGRMAGRMGLLGRLGLAGLAVGGLVTGANQIGGNQGESFLGMRRGEGGLLSSRASGYGANIAGGASAGALVGTTILPGLGSLAGGIIGGLAGLITSVIEDKQLDIKSLIGRTWQSTVDWFSNIDWSNVGYDTGVFLRNVTIGIGEALGNIGTAIGDWFRSINWGTVVQDTIRGAGNFLGDTVNAIGDFAGGLTQGASGQRRPTERRATGTVLQGQTLLNGGDRTIRAAEAGPEALLPLARDRHGRLAVTLAGATGMARARGGERGSIKEVNLTGDKTTVEAQDVTLTAETVSSGKEDILGGLIGRVNRVADRLMTIRNGVNRPDMVSRGNNMIEDLTRGAQNIGQQVMHGGGPSRQVFNAIAQAARETGQPLGRMLNMARRESSFNPTIGVGTSSATGLYQFIDQTWLEQFQKHGAQFGQGNLARQITRDDRGRFTVSDPAVRRQIMAMRTDPLMNARLGGTFTNDNAAALRNALGREPTSSDLYLAHFMGVGGAVQFLRKLSEDPNGPAAAYFPTQARANPSLFRGSMQSAYQEITRGMSAQDDQAALQRYSPSTTATATATTTPMATSNATTDNNMLQPAAWRALVNTAPPDVPAAPPPIPRPDPTLPPNMTTQRRPPPPPVARPPMTTPIRSIDTIPLLTQSGLAVLTLRNFM